MVQGGERALHLVGRAIRRVRALHLTWCRAGTAPYHLNNEGWGLVDWKTEVRVCGDKAAEKDYLPEEESQKEKHLKRQNAGIYFLDLPSGLDGEDFQGLELRKECQFL